MKDLRIKHEPLVRMNELKPKDWALLHSYNEKKKKLPVLLASWFQLGRKYVLHNLLHIYFLGKLFVKKMENT